MCTGVKVLQSYLLQQFINASSQYLIQIMKGNNPKEQTAVTTLQNYH